MNLDAVNGCFETFGALTLAWNCWLTFKSKEVKGVSMLSTLFFASWGYFNCFFYPSLNQQYSFLGGILCATVNTIWLCQMIYYTKFYNKEV